MTQHKTARGALMAKLEWSKIAPGQYVVEGYGVIMRAEASGSRPGRWDVIDADANTTEVTSLTAALQLIDIWVTETATVVAEVEIVDETPELVVAEVADEPVVAEVQEDVEIAGSVEIVQVERTTPTPKPNRKFKTRRSELLVTLGAREVGTAEYDVAGHHVEYVAPGVMPRNAGGRWRTTLLADDGVVVSWNLSLTAALEVVAERVTATVTESTDERENVSA